MSKAGRAFKNFLISNWLSLAMLTAIVIGAGVGFGLKKQKEWTNREIMYIGFLGELFMNLLKGICVPLVASCLIIAFGTLDTRLAKTFGVQMFIFAIATKVFCVALGMIMAIALKPGSYSRAPKTARGIEMNYKKETIDNFLDMICNIFPDNMLDIFLRQTTTNITEGPNNEQQFERVMIPPGNMLGLVSVSIFLGLAMKAIGKKNKALVDVIVVFGKVTFTIVNLIMMAAPVLLIFLIADNTLKIEIEQFLSSIGIYALATSATMVVYFLIVSPLIVFVFGKTNPFKFYLGNLEAITTSFAISSSMASVPVAIKCLEDNMGYDKNLVSFVVPVSIATSKDGACINLAFTSIFFAQYTGMDIGASGYILIALFSFALSVAAPGVPQGVLIMLVVVLEAVGIPANFAGTIIAVDIIVDRIVTMLNVFGACVCVAVVDNYSKKKRAKLAEDMAAEDKKKELEEPLEEPPEAPAEET